jgi:hypothetical protein
MIGSAVLKHTITPSFVSSDFAPSVSQKSSTHFVPSTTMNTSNINSQKEAVNLSQRPSLSSIINNNNNNNQNSAKNHEEKNFVSSRSSDSRVEGFEAEGDDEWSTQWKNPPPRSSIGVAADGWDFSSFSATTTAPPVVTAAVTAAAVTESDIIRRPFLLFRQRGVWG